MWERRRREKAMTAHGQLSDPFHSILSCCILHPRLARSPAPRTRTPGPAGPCYLLYIAHSRSPIQFPPSDYISIMIPLTLLTRVSMQAPPPLPARRRRRRPAQSRYHPARAVLPCHACHLPATVPVP
ncbi:hypothetical protein DENSPDRAFT_182726 [Dentipellis sp. KUC8613]|nr:hypothetical protein DENSPDRAFT_182726 [Dentipellis sp. KUC8613]